MSYVHALTKYRTGYHYSILDGELQDDLDGAAHDAAGYPDLSRQPIGKRKLCESINDIPSWSGVPRRDIPIGSHYHFTKGTTRPNQINDFRTWSLMES
jgi:hypothetical protein